MIIVNSKNTPSYQTLSNHRAFSTGLSSQKQYDSIKQLQNEEELSIVQWIKQNFCEEYSHCRKINRIDDLFNGIALAEIISSFLPSEQQKENFLNQVELVEKLQTKHDFQTAVKNLDLVINTVKQMFHEILSEKQYLNKKDKNQPNLLKLIQISMKSLQTFSGQSLIGNKNKMKNFMMQIVMILPEISSVLKPIIQNKTNEPKKQKQNTKPFKTESNTKNNLKKSKRQLQAQQYRTQAKYNTMGTENQLTQLINYNNIEQLSSIIGYPMQNNEKTYFSKIQINHNSQKDSDHYQKTLNPRQTSHPSCPQDQYEENYEEEYIYEMLENQRQFQNKVQKLLGWIQSAYIIDISQLMEPHLLLGQLVNNILAPNRLKDNEKPIKPTHYQLGSYSVYKKALDLLTQVQRLNKTNLITLMKQVEVGKVNQKTFWNLIEDIQSMVKNKVSEPMATYRKNSRPKSVKKKTEQSQKIYTQYDQNLNIDNIKNHSVTELLKQKQNPSQKSNRLKDALLYAQDTIKQTQLWLQNQMGMGHPLSKSKPNAKTTLYENPLLNGTLYAKIIQRLKIGLAKGIIAPIDKKQLKTNIDIVKNELLNRGYEVARKLDTYKPSYNFYIGLLSQIREIHLNKQSNTKRQIMDDKQKRQFETAQTEIPETEKILVQKWLLQEFNQTIQQVNGTKQVSLKLLKTVIEAIVNINFLKQTTEKIRLLNYIKLLEFFRSIGFSHYCIFRVEDIVSENILNNRKTQNIRWMILRDLKIIKGDKSN